jgi:hypothetical protein
MVLMVRGRKLPLLQYSLENESPRHAAATSSYPRTICQAAKKQKIRVIPCRMLNHVRDSGLPGLLSITVLQGSTEIFK